MNKLIFALAGSAMMLAAPAFASTPEIIDSRCATAFSTQGCIFTNINPYTDEELSTAYNDAGKPGADIELHRLAKFEWDNAPNGWEPASGFTVPAGASVTGNAGGTSGNWTLPGFLIDFVVVKSSLELALFGYDPALAGAGTWSTASLFNAAGKAGPEVSHIVFYGKFDDGGNGDPGGIPEPSSWAMLIAGFGLVGAVARRRASRTLTVAA
jgi:hypothetical protein